MGLDDVDLCCIEYVESLLTDTRYHYPTDFFSIKVFRGVELGDKLVSLALELVPRKVAEGNAENVEDNSYFIKLDLYVFGEHCKLAAVSRELLVRDV